MTGAEVHVVLAAVDLGPQSASVLSAAVVEAAGRTSARLHVVHVIGPGAGPVGTPMAVAPSELPGFDVSAELDAMRTLVERALTRHRLVSPAQPPLGAELHVGWGEPANDVVWLAAYLEADVIVVGTHGRRGVRRMVLGSVAEHIIRGAGCRVLVVRDKAHLPRHGTPAVCRDRLRVELPDELLPQLG